MPKRSQADNEQGSGLLDGQIAQESKATELLAASAAKDFLSRFSAELEGMAFKQRRHFLQELAKVLLETGRRSWEPTTFVNQLAELGIPDASYLVNLVIGELASAGIVCCLNVRLNVTDASDEELNQLHKSISDHCSDSTWNLQEQRHFEVQVAKVISDLGGSRSLLDWQWQCGLEGGLAARVLAEVFFHRTAEISSVVLEDTPLTPGFSLAILTELTGLINKAASTFDLDKCYDRFIVDDYWLQLDRLRRASHLSIPQLCSRISLDLPTDDFLTPEEPKSYSEQTYYSRMQRLQKDKALGEGTRDCKKFLDFYLSLQQQSETFSELRDSLQAAPSHHKFYPVAVRWVLCRESTVSDLTVYQTVLFLLSINKQFHTLDPTAQGDFLQQAQDEMFEYSAVVYEVNRELAGEKPEKNPRNREETTTSFLPLYVKLKPVWERCRQDVRDAVIRLCELH